MTNTTYTAAIGTRSDVVDGDHCDLSIVENIVAGYRVDDNGHEIPETAMGDMVVLKPVQLDVRVDDQDVYDKAQQAADDALVERGWTRTDAWDLSDNAMYAPVERS